MNYEQLTMNYANKNKPNLVRHSLGEGGSKPIQSQSNPKQTQMRNKKSRFVKRLFR